MDRGALADPDLLQALAPQPPQAEVQGHEAAGEGEGGRGGGEGEGRAGVAEGAQGGGR